MSKLCGFQITGTCAYTDILKSWTVIFLLVSLICRMVYAKKFTSVEKLTRGFNSLCLLGQSMCLHSLAIPRPPHPRPTFVGQCHLNVRHIHGGWPHRNLTNNRLASWRAATVLPGQEPPLQRDWLIHYSERLSIKYLIRETASWKTDNSWRKGKKPFADEKVVRVELIGSSLNRSGFLSQSPRATFCPEPMPMSFWIPAVVAR